MELQHLIDQALPSEQSCSATQYLSAEDEVPVCVGMSGDDWESEFLEQLGCGSYTQEREEGDECAQECEEMDEEPEPTVKTFSEALHALDDVKLFLEHRGLCQEAGMISSVGDAVACAQVKSLKQATLFDYMTHNPTV